MAVKLHHTGVWHGQVPESRAHHSPGAGPSFAQVAAPLSFTPTQWATWVMPTSWETTPSTPGGHPLRRRMPMRAPCWMPPLQTPVRAGGRRRGAWGGVGGGARPCARPAHAGTARQQQQTDSLVLLCDDTAPLGHALRHPADGRGRALIVGGGIANFTNVAATFKGIIQVGLRAGPGAQTGRFLGRRERPGGC